MFRMTVHCDVCNKNLPIEQIETSFGKIEVVKVGKTKVVDTNNLFKHLCKECALTIDNELLKFKLEVLEMRG